MRLLLDESVPDNLRFLFLVDEAITSHYMLWAGKPDSDVLALAKDRFDAIITCDQSIPYQQNITGEGVAVIVLHGRTNTMEDLAPLIPKVLDALQTISRGQVLHIYPLRSL